MAKVAPLFSRFYMGGENDIRGFEIWGISPYAYIPSSGTVNIYNPDGSFLVRTPDPKLHPGGNMQYVSAARIAVDIWRNLFTLNYSTFKGPGGRTEPSVSQWMPTPPLFDVDNTTANFNTFKNGDMAAIRVIFTAHKITLSASATIKTVSTDGHWTITDGQKRYDVIASVCGSK